MSNVPSEVRLDHSFVKWDKDWINEVLPEDTIEIHRDFEPDIESDTIPSTIRQDPLPDPNLAWPETAIDQIQMGTSRTETPPQN
ncbi:unnamed protein product [Caenorhabditis auriculariae]|uniref:Anaphase-promoting complex subunit 13 n=1 Tax=Caenorhabditis auriculariae TaxID=2777116 RepID=A0A8S1HGI1_9PELO|nr:unnamed protein product [Caenorhabditis auriculariae]